MATFIVCAGGVSSRVKMHMEVVARQKGGMAQSSGTGEPVRKSVCFARAADGVFANAAVVTWYQQDLNVQGCEGVLVDRLVTTMTEQYLFCRSNEGGKLDRCCCSVHVRRWYIFSLYADHSCLVFLSSGGDESNRA